MKSKFKGQNRDTVGSLALKMQEEELLNPSQHSVIDQAREQTKDFDKNIHLCIKENKNKLEFKNKDFYIVVLVKKEKLMQNVNRAMFYARQTCPTPQYDQILYKFYKDGRIDFLWVVPTRDIARFMINNKALVHPEEYKLLQYVIDYYAGKLLAKAKALNGEKKNSSFLEH